MQFRGLNSLLLAVVIAISLLGTTAHATTLTWGVNGVGGSGNWDTSTANWFNGSQNVAWPSGGDAVLSGVSGGAVNSFTFGPVVSSITFNTAGYTIQNGWLQGGLNGLSVNTNVDATISSTLTNSAFNANVLTKAGPAALIINGTNFLDLVQINQGEVRVIGSSSFFFNDVNLANVSGATATLAQSSNSAQMQSLSGGGASGGVVHPNNQLRTVTLTVSGGGNMGARWKTMAAAFWPSTLPPARALKHSPTPILIPDQRESTPERWRSGNGSVANSPSLTMTGSLVLDNSAAVVANRISNSAPVSMTSSSIGFIGNSSTPVEEVMGALSFTGVCNISVTQPGNAADQLTFASLQRNDHAVLNVTGPGVKFVGLANSSTGILPPYITAGNEWATVGGDGRLTPLSSYTSDINTGSTNDHVKFTSVGTFTLASAATRGSLNFQNADTLVPQILDLSGQSLALTTGGILSSGNAPSAIQNGTLSTASGEFVIIANNNLIVSDRDCERIWRNGPDEKRRWHFDAVRR